ncbi:uncharacterized protein isoform X2 [Choristoneura fumiferana]|uniref:uncharacterized protein isoform X2 n=1 Tax=Choristoneura fumiferana TaxID=7141 RepID=UPI003D159129
MSFLSTTENVGFSGIPQNIADGSCATQFKLAVEGASGNCGDVNMFIHDSSGDEQAYIPHLNDNFFQSKFKIDPNELYTFHDSDVIAGEITVSHTDDSFMFPDNVEVKAKFLDSPNSELDLRSSLTNGDIKDEIKLEVANGHYSPESRLLTPSYKDVKTTNTKVPKAKTSGQGKETARSNSVSEVRRPSVHSPKGQSNNVASCKKVSINSVNTNHVKSASNPKATGSETFLDVFKREQGLVENPPAVVKTEPGAPTPAKVSTSSGKKAASAKTSQSKVRRGRGPAVHEALQRIPVQRALPVLNRSWHAPGQSLFDCGPLDDRKPTFRQFESSSDDENGLEFGPVSVEDGAADSRGARLALRRAALRRHVMRADTSLRLARDFREHKSLAAIVKKQLNGQGPSCRLPPQMVNHLLAMRGMPEVLSSRERGRLRGIGWSGGESGALKASHGTKCSEDGCEAPRLPCGRYCLSHVTLAPEQRLYAACAAVFAGGARCKQPILPLHEQTPLCAEHAWKRDNYDKLSRDCKPKKLARKRVCPATPRRAKRRRRPARPRPAPAPNQSLSEINVCSNSSAYDSSEDTAMGALSENEFIVSAGNSHELEVGEVGQVPPDDILDPAVLSQIPDEAFTEFFNQAEGGSSFAESSELAAALEAVLDERVLDERALDSIADCVFTHSPHAAKPKMQVPASVAMELSSSAPS